MIPLKVESESQVSLLTTGGPATGVTRFNGFVSAMPQKEEAGSLLVVGFPLQNHGSGNSSRSHRESQSHQYPPPSEEPVILMVRSRSKLERCQEIIDYFQDQSLLICLDPRSGASHRLASNERLAFDAFWACQWLYEDYPEYNEGDLTKINQVCGVPVASSRTWGDHA